MNDIVRTVRGEPSWVLDATKSLHPNLQFTLGETISEGILPLLDLKKNVLQDTRVTCNWYQKPTKLVRKGAGIRPVQNHQG